MFVKPKQGLKILDPDTRIPLPEDGQVVSDTTYWHRRLRDGDVELVDQKKDNEENG